MDNSPIISTHDLAKILTTKTLRIVDCRFNLGDPNWGQDMYHQAHIPGARYAHLNLDLSGPVGPYTGRHPLPDAENFLQKLAGWGISPGTLVVVYDTVGGAFASRLWFMLRAIGHKLVKVLDGGLQKWQADEYPLSTGSEGISPVEGSSVYAKNFDLQRLADTPAIAAAINDPSIVVIDARAPERFKGLQEPIDPVAGHIPGSVNRFHGSNLSSEGIFKPQELLRQEFQNLLGDHTANQAVVYCGSGVTSCHHLVALEIAGMAGARLYAGSWSEWIRDPSHPVATGKE